MSRFALPPRAPAALLVLLLHAGLLALFTATQAPLQQRVSMVIRLIDDAPPEPRRARERSPAAAQATNAQSAPVRLMPPDIERPPVTSSTEAAAAQTTPVGEPVRPLDLRLPAPLRAPGAAPSLHETIRADPRANSPRESAEQRMANALGARGWTVTELADGGRKITGPFGECLISRESMMIAIDPGNPRWEGLPNKLFGCGGIEKGSLKHERPK